MIEAIRELEEIAGLVELSEKRAKQVIARAINDTMKSIRHQMLQVASGMTDVMYKILRERTHLIKANVKNLEGDHSMIILSIPAILLGARQNASGVKAGKHFFRSAFIAKANKGPFKFRVYRRKYKRYNPEHPGYPIEDVRIPIKEDTELAHAYAERQVDEKFLKNLTRHLKLAGGLL